MVFLVGGTLLELLALELARPDLRDAHNAESQREGELKKLMAAGKHTTHAWISRATRTRVTV